jgi:hypothetical protein
MMAGLSTGDGRLDVSSWRGRTVQSIGGHSSGHEKIGTKLILLGLFNNVY